MADWRSVVNGDPVDWLLEKGNPSVRYYTLRDILESPESDPEVVNAKQDIMKAGIVPAILGKQHDEGYWVDPKRFYTAKYTGTVWQIIILAELGASENDPGIKKACEFILNNSQDPESGGFSQSSAAKVRGGRHSEVIPCLTGNMVWALIRLGYLEDPRVKEGIKWIATYQRFDDGIDTPQTGWPYDQYEMCWGRHTCHMGVVKSLKALAEIPEDKRSVDVKGTIEKAVEYLLIHHIYKKSHDLKRDSKPGWRKLGFPLMYQTDILEVLGILTGLGCKDERMKDAMDVLLSKQDEHGRWSLENTFNGRFQADIERKGERSKWITLNALKAIKRYY